DVFAAPAPRDHGLATVYLEAMASGKPVIAASEGGAPEAVLEGETGLLVDTERDDSCAEALSALLSDPTLARRLGANGRRRVLEHFSVDRLVERTVAAYERAVEARYVAVGAQ